MKGLGSDRCTKVQKSPDPNKNWSGFATLKLSLDGITHWQPGVKVNNQQNFEKFQESVAISDNCKNFLNDIINLFMI